MSRAKSETAILVQLLDEAFSRKSWHGANLRGSLRGLTATQAGWRPGPRRHSIAEIVVHAAYWKYTVRRRLRNEQRGSFRLKGSNWFVLPEPLTEDAWREHVALLIDEHALLREAVAAVLGDQLERPVAGSRTTRGTLIRGIILHDIYHTGQIQLIKALFKSRQPAG